MKVGQEVVIEDPSSEYHGARGKVSDIIVGDNKQGESIILVEFTDLEDYESHHFLQRSVKAVRQ